MRNMLGLILVLSWAGPVLASEKDIVDTAVAADFKTLVAAVKAADLVDTLKGSGPFTVFAPPTRRSPSSRRGPSRGCSNRRTKTN